MRITPNLIRTVVFSILLVAVGATGGYRVGKYGVLVGSPTRNISSEFKLVNFESPSQQVEQLDFAQFWEVWGLLQQNYYQPEDIQPDKMLHGAIQGLASSLGDPYTSYLPPVDNQRAAEDLQGSFYGVGIQLGYIDSTLAVIAPLEGTPSDNADIEAGDLILRVKDEAKDFDESTDGWSLAEAVSNIRGEKGTVVQLTLYRPDNDQYPEPFEVDVTRGEIVVPSVEVEFVEVDGVKAAHLKVTRFGERTLDEWDEAVAQIKAEPDLAGIVLDMRNNPGGLFDDAVEMGSDFIPSGVLVTQSGRYNSRTFKSTGAGRLKDIPTVVLVNQGSASASEILAGALRDRIGAKLVGQPTFGKGTVQDRHVLDNEAAIHITVAQWLLPSGEWIHEEGIPVTVEVVNDPETEQDEMLETAVRELQS